jgi:hypothetical protein
MIGIILLISTFASVLLLAYSIYNYLKDPSQNRKSEHAVKLVVPIQLLRDSKTGQEELQLRDGTKVTLSPSDMQRLSKGIISLEELEAEYISYKDLK